MTKNNSIFLSVTLFFLILFTSCGPSAEEKRIQEKEDSIRLENERRELIDRANRMYENSSADTLSKADTDTD